MPASPPTFHAPKFLQAPVKVGVSAVLLTLGIFLLIPLTQLLETAGREGGLTVSADIAPPPPPPPPDPPEEEEEEEPEEEPPPPPPPAEPPRPSLNQLDLALEPGIGDAMGSFGLTGFSLQPNAVEEMQDLFDVSELDEPPRFLAGSQPEKPFSLRSSREDGFTRVEIIIDQRGNVERILGFDQTTHRELERAVRDVVETWRFTPPTRNGERVRSNFIVPVRF